MNNLFVHSNCLAIFTEQPEQPVLSKLKLVEDSLAALNFKGKVVFDLLISKGFDGRFLEADFDGSHIMRESIKIASEKTLPTEILQKQFQYFQSNLYLLRLSVLSRVERKVFA